MFFRKRQFPALGFSYGIALLALAALARAQGPPTATVSFTFDFPGSDPAHYVISANADGSGSYVSSGKAASSSDDASDNSFRRDFTLSSETATQIFNLAKTARYFEGALDSKKKGLASTGAKTLAYKNGDKTTQATYNYSLIPAVQQLTTIFQNLSATLEFGQRLEFDLHYQKLAVDEDLKQMEDAVNAGQLGEVATIAPILQKIVQDPTVVNVARARAQRLLEVKPGRRP